MPPSEAARADRRVRAPGNITSVLARALAIVALAGIAGLVHSTRVPIQLALKPVNPAPATPDPALPGPSAPSQTQGPASAPPPPSSDAANAQTLGARITIAQARALFDDGSADFIDAREPFEFDPGHIPGAYNLTQAHFAAGSTPEALEFLDPARPVVIYCGGGDCHASENVAILLQQAGFTTIHIMTDGFPAWVSAGHEVEASSTAEPEGSPK